jgi:type I restriction enzyme S subunit
VSEASINQDDLPITWTLTKLGSVVNYGSTNKAEPNEIGNGDWILELEDIEKDSSRLIQKMTFLQRQSKSTKNHFQAGDVLYGKLRPYLNKVLIAGEPGYCTTEILPLKAGPHIDNRYLFYWLKHPVFLKYV